MNPIEITKMDKHRDIKVIRTYFPFIFSEKIDPRAIHSVGEQVQAEHLFAFHSRTDLKSGFRAIL